MVEKINKTKNTLQKAFNDYNYFTFIRIGDGDLILMKGQSKEQRHKNSPELKKELKESVEIVNEKYIVSSTAGTFEDGSGSYFWLPNKLRKSMDSTVTSNLKKFRPSGTEYHALVFQYCFEHEPEWFVEFFRKNLKDKKVLFIGGQPLCNKDLVNKVFNVSDTISFPGVSNAYYELDKKMDLINKKAEKSDVIIPCIGMATRVLAKRFWKQNNKKIVLDVGVAVDALAEAKHRGWTRRMVNKGFVGRIKGCVYE